MKQSIKNLSMAALVILGTILSGCEKIEIAQPEEKEDNIVVCTTTVSFDSATKALTEHGVKTFAEGETIAVIYKNDSNETVKAVSSPLPSGNYGNTASFTVSLTNPASNAAVRIIYPSNLAATTVAADVDVDADATINYSYLGLQDGTLATLASELDLAVYDGTLEGTVLPANPALKNKLAICKYVLKDSPVNPADAVEITSSITHMTISDGTHNYVVFRTSNGSTIYVAIRPTDNATIFYTATDGKHFYKKTVSGKTYQASQMYQLALKMWPSEIIDLSLLTDDYMAQDGQTLTGMMISAHKISIAAGATVTLENVSINATGAWSGMSNDGIRCGAGGNITINLVGTNIVRGENYCAGIYVPSTSTLTIQGNGSLNAIGGGPVGGAGIGGQYNSYCGNIIIAGGAINATGGSCAAGIGTGDCNSNYTRTCGYITISDGTVTATGGSNAAGIGSSDNCGCGLITISGGTVTATGGSFAPGIGSGANKASCDGVTITSGVAKVTATKGSSAPNSIGAGNNSTCGTVTIDGVEGAISDSPYTYSGIPEGALSGKFSVGGGKQVYFSKGNLKYDGSNWSFHEHQYDRVFTSNGTQTSHPMDLFCWGNVDAPAYDGNTYVTGSDNLSGSTDWGSNAITNGGNTANSGWRTLTGNSYGEWDYLFTRRTNASDKWGLATIDDRHAGIVILPDYWATPAGCSFTAAHDSWTANTYTLEQWNKMEAAGAVFLPAAGVRDTDGKTVRSVGTFCAYWSSTATSIGNNAHYLSFTKYMTLTTIASSQRSNGFSVRLVMDAN